MNIRDLQYFVALVEHNHFGKAAEACFVSQPALSMQIKKLENELGVLLLERNNKSVLLTDIGKVIAYHARQILSQVTEVREIAKSSRDPYSGEFRIGIFPTLAPYLLPQIIPPLSKMYPKLSLYLVEEQSSALIEQLKQGKLHAAFLAQPVAEIGLSSANLFEEEFLLAASNTHLLAKRKTIKQLDLRDKNLLLLDEGHCMREQALALCERVKAVETQNFRATSLETLRHMVTAGVGITLMPKLACQLNSNICYIPFSDPKPVRTIRLAWRAAANKTVFDHMASNLRKIMLKQKGVKVIN